MDYSSIHEDTEDAATNSPWATSPQRSKNGFGDTSASNESPSPTPALPQSSYLSNGASQRTNPSNEDSSQQKNTTAQSSGYSARNETANLPNRPQQNAQRQDQGYREQQSQSHSQGLARPQPQQRQPSNRSSQGLPQYKLQPKLTGLERQGRKDPILRFDIYVSVSSLLTRSSLTYRLRQIYRHFEPHNFATCAELMLSSLSSRIISFLPTPKHWFQHFLHQRHPQAWEPTKMKLG